MKRGGEQMATQLMANWERIIIGVLLIAAGLLWLSVCSYIAYEVLTKKFP